MKMLTWAIGVRTQFSSNPGYCGKYFARYLEPEEWAMLLQTYAAADPADTWRALSVMCDLFRLAALTVAEHGGFVYPHADDARVCAHLEHVRLLPRHAQALY